MSTDKKTEEMKNNGITGTKLFIDHNDPEEIELRKNIARILSTDFSLLKTEQDRNIFISQSIII